MIQQQLYGAEFASAGDPVQRHRRRIVYGWLGFVEQIALDWGSNRDCPPETIVGLAADAFRRLTA